MPAFDRILKQVLSLTRPLFALTGFYFLKRFFFELHARPKNKKMIKNECLEQPVFLLSDVATPDS
jgi:hypothetical protein